MNWLETYFKLLVFLGFILIITINAGYQNDLISAIRAVGIQCNVDHVITFGEEDERSAH